MQTTHIDYAATTTLLQVYDADMAKMETFLGRCTIDVARLPANEKKSLRLALHDVSSGTISVVCEYIPLGSERAAEGTAEAEDSDSDYCGEGDILYDAFPDELGNEALQEDDLQDHLLDEDQDHSGVWAWSAPQATIPVPATGSNGTADPSAGSGNASTPARRPPPGSQPATPAAFTTPVKGQEQSPMPEGTSGKSAKRGPSSSPSTPATSFTPRVHTHPSSLGGSGNSGALQVTGIRLRNLKCRVGLFGGQTSCFVQCAVNNFVKRTKPVSVSQ